jgi:hypothetical protein
MLNTKLVQFNNLLWTFPLCPLEDIQEASQLGNELFISLYVFYSILLCLIQITIAFPVHNNIRLFMV